LPNRFAVDPQRDVVQEEAAVHAPHVDHALDPSVNASMPSPNDGRRRCKRLPAVAPSLPRRIRYRIG
jgi:hypothetical protein